MSPDTTPPGGSAAAPPAQGRIARGCSMLERYGARIADVSSVVGMAAVVIIMLSTVWDYGLTYDEEPHLRLGERVLHFYASGGAEISRALQRTAYGAGFDAFAALLRRVSPWDAFETNHIACVFVAQLGLWGTWKLGRLLGGAWGGLLALAFTVLTPVYYGHQFNNPKDIPFAVGYVWGLYFIARLWQRLSHAGQERVAPGEWLALGVVLALGMSVRLGGAVLVAYLLLAILLHLADVWRLQGSSFALASKGLLGRALLTSLLAWGLMALAWPRALFRPVAGPVAALQTVTHFTRYDSPTWLAGRKFSSNHVPWDYLPTYFAVQLPELLIACFALALVTLGVCTGKRLRAREPLPVSWWIVALAVLLPPTYAVLRGSTLYNGLRHFLFLIPPLSALSGAALALTLGRVWRWRSAVALPLALPLAAFALDQVLAMQRLHPHQHVFFNRASGGIAAAVGNYETEYYGSVYRELLGLLRDRLWQERREQYLAGPIRVSGCGSKLFFTENLPLNFEYRSMRQSGRADYYASYVRDECLRHHRDRELLTSVKRDGAVLAVARDMKAKRPKARRASPARP